MAHRGGNSLSLPGIPTACPLGGFPGNGEGPGVRHRWGEQRPVPGTHRPAPGGTVRQYGQPPAGRVHGGPIPTTTAALTCPARTVSAAAGRTTSGPAPTCTATRRPTTTPPSAGSTVRRTTCGGWTGKPKTAGSRIRQSMSRSRLPGEPDCRHRRGRQPGRGLAQLAGGRAFADGCQVPLLVAGAHPCRLLHGERHSHMGSATVEAEITRGPASLLTVCTCRDPARHLRLPATKGRLFRDCSAFHP